MRALEILVVSWALANIKVWPLMFHARFYFYCFVNFYLRRKVRAKSLFEPSVYLTYTPLLEMDFNLHKSNSTYFSDMDMSRTKLMVHVFKAFFLEYRDKGVKMAKHEFTYTPLGSVGLVFRKEIPGYVLYNVKSRVLGWTSKWLFVLTMFERKGHTYAYGLSKYVFKQKRKTVPPSKALEFCGLLTPEAIEANEKVSHFLEMSLNLEEVGEVFHLN